MQEYERWKVKKPNVDIVSSEKKIIRIQYGKPATMEIVR